MLSNRKRRYKALTKYLYWWAGEHSDKMVAKEHKIGMIDVKPSNHCQN